MLKQRKNEDKRALELDFSDFETEFNPEQYKLNSVIICE